MKFEESKAYFTYLKEVYELNKSFFEKDLFIKDHLLLLKEAIERTKKVFMETGSFQYCAECAKAGKKCCSEGLEWKLSPAEFMLNLKFSELYGIPLEFEKSKKGDCLFLGERGCMLFLVPLFCRNFFCFDLSKFLGPSKLIKIQQTMEEEAVLSFKLCDYIKRTLFQKLGL